SCLFPSEIFVSSFKKTENSDIVLFVARIFWPGQCFSFHRENTPELGSRGPGPVGEELPFLYYTPVCNLNIYEDMRIVAHTAAVSTHVTLYRPVAKTTIPILGE
ncbi:hypothetical protein AFLA70_635g000292, partial [Aspergillus flavus AF70]